MFQNTYVPKRLIDPNILSELITNNPLLTSKPTRLLTYKVSNYLPKINPNLKITKKIKKIKLQKYNEIFPNLLNGFIFISVCLVIYYILVYKYNKKKNNVIKNGS